MKTRAILLIFILSIAIYSNSLNGPFIWDDELFVVKNQSIRNLGNFFSFFTDARTGTFGALSKEVYRPIAALSYALDYSIWRLDVFGYHLTNIVFHALNGILVFLLLSLILGSGIPSLLGGLIFVSHPIQTEAVSWISGRSNVLFLFFYLIALIFYIWYSREGKRRFLAYSLISFLLSLFSKEMAITLPFMIVLYEIHYGRKVLSKEKVTVNLLYFLSAASYFVIRSVVVGRVAQTGWWGEGPYHTFLTMVKVLAGYVKVMILPVNLSAVFYPVPVSTSIAETPVIFSLLLLAAILLIAVISYRRNRDISFFIWWFFITLLPVLNIIPIKALQAERFLYLPSIGFSVLLAIILAAWYGRTAATGRNTRFFVIAVIVLVIGGYSFKVVARNEDWNDPIRISAAAIKENPMNPWALTSLGSYLVEKGRYDEAVGPLEKAALLSGEFYLAHYTLGSCYLKMARYGDAIREFGETLRLKVDSVEALNGLGVAYASLKRYGEAREKFESAMRLDPGFINSYLNMGRLSELEGLHDEAIGYYEKIIEKSGDRNDVVSAYLRIAKVYENTNDPAAAEAYYKKAEDIFGGNLRGVIE